MGGDSSDVLCEVPRNFFGWCTYEILDGPTGYRDCRKRCVRGGEHHGAHVGNCGCILHSRNRRSSEAQEEYAGREEKEHGNTGIGSIDRFMKEKE